MTWALNGEKVMHQTHRYWQRRKKKVRRWRLGRVLKRKEEVRRGEER